MHKRAVQYALMCAAAANTTSRSGAASSAPDGPGIRVVENDAKSGTAGAIGSLTSRKDVLRAGSFRQEVVVSLSWVLLYLHVCKTRPGPFACSSESSSPLESLHLSVENPFHLSTKQYPLSLKGYQGNNIPCASRDINGTIQQYPLSLNNIP